MISPLILTDTHNLLIVVGFGKVHSALTAMEIIQLGNDMAKEAVHFL